MQFHPPPAGRRFQHALLSAQHESDDEAGAAVLAPILIICAFPPRVRFSGFSLSYNISYALFGGITPPCFVDSPS
jgi:hypothetical protein